MENDYLNIILINKSFSNLRVLIFRDSSIRYLKYYLGFYFREMFLYWDHGNLNKDLIKYYKPDLILEIRIVRYRKYAYCIMVSNKENITL